jgi:putative PIN family toxin of toxin-antitoxin system
LCSRKKYPIIGFTCITKLKARGVELRVVFDTSVLVAASRSRNGASFQLLSMLPNQRFQIALTIALYTEWQAVLTRPEHIPTGLEVDDVLGFLRYVASLAHLQDVHFLWRPFLRDPDDDMVVECAVASRCQYIVTHNVKDFKRTTELQVQAITPAEFLTILRSTS